MNAAQQESSTGEKLLELELPPVNLRAFSRHPEKIEQLALLIAPVASRSYEQRYLEAATADLLTSLLAFICEHGGPKEQDLNTVYRLCDLVNANSENAVDLMFKQVEEGVSYDKVQHAWKRDYWQTPILNGFSSRRYRSFKRYTSLQQRAEAAQHARALLAEIATTRGSRSSWKP